jgi:hypothetical protein
VKIGRKTMYILTGLAAGLAAWPVLEAFIHNQEMFPDYFILTAVSGTVLGAVIGAVFSTASGFFKKEGLEIIKGLLSGLVLGAAAGLAGFVAGQLLLNWLGSYFFNEGYNLNRTGLIASRAVSWALAGTLIGAGEGIRELSVRKIILGKAGGFAGGLTGGALLEILSVLYPENAFFRALSLALLGTAIAFFYSFFEKAASFGVLRVLNGADRGKKFIIAGRRTLMGLLPSCTVNLKKYRAVKARHAVITVKKRLLNIKAAPEAKLYVNDELVQEAVLKNEDVIKIGTARFIFTLN